MHDAANKIEPGILRSWKEIASYVGCGVRTVQRYEQQFGLPVRRPEAKLRSSVIALADEVDVWLKQAYVLRDRNVQRGRLCPFCCGTGFVARAREVNALDAPVQQSSGPHSLGMR